MSGQKRRFYIAITSFPLLKVDRRHLKSQRLTWEKCLCKFQVVRFLSGLLLIDHWSHALIIYIFLHQIQTLIKLMVVTFDEKLVCLV